MKALPLYVVTGFLSTGKSTFINEYWRRTYVHGERPILVQFEEGMTEPTGYGTEGKDVGTHGKEAILRFAVPEEGLSKNAAFGDEGYFTKISDAICNAIEDYQGDSLWIEWNGMSPFHQLEELLYQTLLYEKVFIKEIVYVTNPTYHQQMMGKTGDANLSQLANATSAIVMSPSGQIGESLHEYNDRIPIYTDIASFIEAEGTRKKIDIASGKDFSIILAFVLAAFGGLYFFAEPLLPASMHKLIAIFTGLFLQAFPFLLVGVVVSALFQYYLSPTFMEKALSKNMFVGTFFALLGGFLFPVCDCSTIPIFRSMVGRKIPIPVGLTFMLASPIINPITVLSTYYAFGLDWTVAISRTLLGAITAILVGYCFIGYKGLDHLKLDTTVASYRLMYGMGNRRIVKTKWQGFLVHSQREFFKMGTYLMLGIFFSSLFQVYVTPVVKAQGWDVSTPIAIIIMMIFAFFLSLCSSSDAMIARALGVAFPAMSHMSFMLMGPMMDLKNVIMLQSIFPKHFVLRLALTVTVVVFLVAMGYSYGNDVVKVISILAS